MTQREKQWAVGRITSAKDSPLASMEQGCEMGVERPPDGNDKADLALPDAIDPDDPPDGGWEAWLVLIGAFFAFMCSFGWLQCIGIFQDYYSSHSLRALSPSTIAWIPSVQSFMLYLWGPVAGKIYDTYGPTWPILIGSIFSVLGMMLTSISTKYYQIFLSQSICWAIGTSFIFYSTTNALGTWFKKRLALAFAISVCGPSLGGVVFPIMMDRIIPILGFGWAMRIAGFFNVVLLVLVVLTVKSRLPPQHRPLRAMEFVEPFTELPFLLVAVGSFLIYWSIFLPYNYVLVQAKEAGMSAALGQYLVPIMNATSVPGRLIPGYLADKYGVFNVFIVTGLLTGLLDLALWLPAKSDAAIIVFAGLYGAFGGGIFSMFPAIVAHISDVRELGVRNGALFSLGSFAILTGNPIGGALVSLEHGGYSGLKIFAGVIFLTGVFFYIVARTVLVGFNLKVRV